jgi:hypothetical protein
MFSALCYFIYNMVRSSLSYVVFHPLVGNSIPLIMDIEANTTTKGVLVRQAISLDLNEFTSCNEWGLVKK